MVTGPMRHTIVIEKWPCNSADYVPRLTRCVALSNSETEAVRKIPGAIRLNIESLRGYRTPVRELLWKATVVDVVAVAGQVRDRSSGFGVTDDPTLNAPGLSGTRSASSDASAARAHLLAAADQLECCEGEATTPECLDSNGKPVRPHQHAASRWLCRTVFGTANPPPARGSS